MNKHSLAPWSAPRASWWRRFHAVMSEIFGSDDYGNNSTLFRWRFRSGRACGLGPMTRLAAFEDVRGSYFLRAYNQRRATQVDADA